MLLSNLLQIHLNLFVRSQKTRCDPSDLDRKVNPNLFCKQRILLFSMDYIFNLRYQYKIDKKVDTSQIGRTFFRQNGFKLSLESE